MLVIAAATKPGWATRHRATPLRRSERSNQDAIRPMPSRSAPHRVIFDPNASPATRTCNAGFRYGGGHEQKATAFPCRPDMVPRPSCECDPMPIVTLKPGHVCPVWSGHLGGSSPARSRAHRGRRGRRRRGHGGRPDRHLLAGLYTAPGDPGEVLHPRRRARRGRRALPPPHRSVPAHRRDPGLPGRARPRDGRSTAQARRG